MNQLILEETAIAGLPKGVQKVLGSAPGRILHFRNAVLARAETNKNRDHIDGNGINELAASLALQAIDLEHHENQIMGFYEGGTVEKETLLSAGYLYASRFPDEVKGLATGEYQFSVEASAKEAECSICHRVFATEREYCEHIGQDGKDSVAARIRFGAERILRGMSAMGGAATRRPAGTNTRADPSQMEFVANVVMAADQTPVPEPQNIVLSFMSEMEYTLYTNKPDLIAKVLDAQDRKNLDSGDFALIQHKDGKTLRRFPINDCSHASNALSRLSSAKDISDEERAAVRRKAEAKLNSKECKLAHKTEAAVQQFFRAYEADEPTSPGSNRNYQLTPLVTPVFSPLLYVPVEPFIEEVLARKSQTPAPKPTISVPPPEPTPPPESSMRAGVSESDPQNRVGGIAWNREPTITSTKPKLKLKWQ